MEEKLLFIFFSLIPVLNSLFNPLIYAVAKTEIFSPSFHSIMVAKTFQLHKMRNLKEKSLDQDRLESQLMLNKDKMLELALTEKNNKEMRP